MIKITNKFPLLNNSEKLCTSAEFISNKYVVLQPINKIIIEYDACDRKLVKIDTDIPYNNITKDCLNSLFYMTKLNDKNTLYRTNNCYKEIDSINLKIPKDYVSNINSISSNNTDCKILISNDKKIYSVDKNGNFISSEISSNTTNTLLGTNVINSTCVINRCECTSQLPNKIENRFTCAGYYCGNKYVAYTKDNSAYLASISPNGNIISNEYIDDNIIINSIFSVKGNLQFLITKNNKYNYIYITNLKCCNGEVINIDHCNLCEEACDCNYNVDCLEICDNCKYDYLEIINNQCKKHECSADNNIIESIALIETALSHILNAEGEKIQKIIAMTNDPDELLKVNNSVSQVIKNITFLEHVLYDKLELSKNCENKDKC
ncbi:MAG: hypothetical protein RSA10_03550 [Bacilli bacterium]